MKLFLDFFPIVLFFVAFKLWGIYAATGVAIAATIVQIAWLKYSHGKVEPMQWLSLGIIVLFGGLGLMALFVVGQALYLSRYLKDGKQAEAGARDS